MLFDCDRIKKINANNAKQARPQQTVRRSSQTRKSATRRREQA